MKSGKKGKTPSGKKASGKKGKTPGKPSTSAKPNQSQKKAATRSGKKNSQLDVNFNLIDEAQTSTAKALEKLVGVMNKKVESDAETSLQKPNTESCMKVQPRKMNESAKRRFQGVSRILPASDYCLYT